MLNIPEKAGQAGFTLIELAVVLVIIAIATALGLPSMSEMIRNAEVRTAAESILNGMQTARTEAVRRNALTAFSLTDPGSVGNTGWRVNLAVSGQNIQTREAAEGGKNVTVTPTPGGATMVTFNGFGRTPVNNLNLDGSDLLTQVDLAATGSTRPLRIEVSPGGEIRMCDPSVSATGDTRKC